MSVRILTGDCRETMATLPDASVHCCVTSPPYYGLRDYGHDGQLGLEETPEAYVAGMVDVFREVRRVLRDDGTVWLNIGDSYAHSTAKMPPQRGVLDDGRTKEVFNGPTIAREHGVKPKDLMGIPWRLAFALQADGWWLRSDIIWHKPNPMPESVTDRPTSAHEHIFLLAKSVRYFYDADAIAEEAQTAGNVGGFGGTSAIARALANGREPSGNERKEEGATYIRGATRNRRNVWTVATRPFSDAHFAVYPPDLIEPCIKAGTSEHGCCPECGAPWERVVERETVRAKRDRLGLSMQLTPGEKARVASGIQGIGGGNSHDGSRSPTVTTLGWTSTCEHEAEPVPCTVLDPFGGAGTTGLVADRLGRSAILCELNPEYAAIAERRIRMDAPIFADVEVVV